MRVTSGLWQVVRFYVFFFLSFSSFFFLSGVNFLEEVITKWDERKGEQKNKKKHENGRRMGLDYKANESISRC